ncbi:hypothetical protein B1806_00045 [Metallibacterium scheffleri]|uniref:Uncharacterized protein n=1 Tax=Metallibacterium scheffleri TaxID=993689 RepID=A0A4S3KSZ7_9GAMM|nr:hypothetical protein B1806_00045 [Metallibacterium scheffleri]
MDAIAGLAHQRHRRDAVFRTQKMNLDDPGRGRVAGLGERRSNAVTARSSVAAGIAAQVGPLA